MPRFSIVIPTRNSAYSLKHTLMTCINQKDFDDYEIVVSNNYSTDDTEEIIKQINSDKIRYYKTTKSLTMVDHFNFAISKADGEYVFVLGSDDGVHTYGLYALDKIISITGEKIIKCAYNYYYWPNVVVPKLQNTCIIHDFFDKPLYDFSDTVDAVNKAIDTPFQCLAVLPAIYISGVVHRDIINELLKKTGTVFDSLSPDIYFGFAVSALTHSFLIVPIPFSMAGLSGTSNGMTCIYNVNSTDYKNMEKIENANGRFPKKWLLGTPTICDALIADFTCAKKNTCSYEDINLDYVKLMRAGLSERYVIHMYNGDSGRIAFEAELEIIKNHIKNDDSLSSVFNINSLDIKNYTFYPTEYDTAPYVTSGVIKPDLSLFNVKNIEDAIQFAENLLYPKGRIDSYLSLLAEKWKNRDVVKYFFEKFSDYTKVGIFATGPHTERMIKTYNQYCGKGANLFLFDNDSKKWGKIWHDMEVLPPRAIPEKDLDILIISSRKHENIIYESIKQYSNSTKIIKLYDKNSEHALPDNTFDN